MFDPLLSIEKARRGISLNGDDERLANMYSIGKQNAADILVAIGVTAALVIIGFYLCKV